MSGILGSIMVTGLKCVRIQWDKIILFNRKNVASMMVRLFSIVLFSAVHIAGYAEKIHAEIIFLSDFETGALQESGNIHDGWRPNSLCCDHSLQMVKSPVRAGNYSAKFELKCSDPWLFGGPRAELSLRFIGHEVLGIKMNEEYWYGFSTYLPADWEAETDWLNICQWHTESDPEDEYRTRPIMVFQFYSGGFRIINRYDTSRISTKDTLRERFPYKTSDWRSFRGKWTDWVVHVKWAADSGGFLKIWRDGEVIVDIVDQPVCYNNQYPPWFKLGIYGTNNCPRVLYHDEVRIGDADATYEDIAPGGGRPPVKGFYSPPNLRINGE